MTISLQQPVHQSMMDRRLADPKKFAHIRQELGIDPVPEGDVPDPESSKV